MDVREIPLTYYGILLIVLAGFLSYLQIDGFVHTIVGLVAGYFFSKAVHTDEIKKIEVINALKNSNP